MDHRQKQWINLGEHADVCLTRPDTCGDNGGAVSYWMNVLERGRFYHCGLITTRASGSDGFEVYSPWYRTDKLW